MTRGVDLYADRTSTATMRANQGRIVLAWRTNIAGRWLDPQQHDGTATPDNLLNALHDGLIKNSGAQRFDHLALAEKYEFAEDAESCTFTLRPGVKFHDGSPLTPQDVTWSSEHYRGAWAKVLHEKTGRIEVPDDRTVRFVFKAPFLDFPILMGTSNVCGAGWVVPAKYYEKVGQEEMQFSEHRLASIAVQGREPHGPRNSGNVPPSDCRRRVSWSRWQLAAGQAR